MWGRRYGIPALLSYSESGSEAEPGDFDAILVAWDDMS